MLNPFGVRVWRDFIHLFMRVCISEIVSQHIFYEDEDDIN